MKGGKQLDHMVLGCARWDLDPKNLQNYLSVPFFCFYSRGIVTCQEIRQNTAHSF